MKNYFYAYINHMQDDWVDKLSMIEFVANNHVNASTGVTLFFADYGFYPQTGMELSGIYKDEQKAELLAADEIIKKQTKMMTFL